MNGNHSYSIPGFAEPVNCFTHLAGAGLFAVLTVFLLRQGWGNRGRVIFLSVFAFLCIFVLSMSGVYHLLSFGSTAREVLRRLDHAAIFTLIAGTFTPVFGGYGVALLRVGVATAVGDGRHSLHRGSRSRWRGMAHPRSSRDRAA